MKHFIYFAYTSIGSIVAMAAILPGVEEVQTGAFYALWVLMLGQFGWVAYTLLRWSKSEADIRSVFRGGELEPVPGYADIIRLTVMTALILINGWVLTAIAFVAFEISAVIIYKAIRYFALLAEREEAVDFTAPAANDALKSRPAA